MNFEEVYKEYLLFVSMRQKKQSIDSITQKFNSHILPYFKDMNIYDITRNDIIDWHNEILIKNYSNNFNKNLHFLLSGFLNYCCTYYDLKFNVASQVGCFKKKFEENKSDFYTLKEFKLFIKFVDNEIYKQFFNLMFYTGTRPGEAMALKFSDLKGNYLSINKTIHSHGSRDLDTPKNLSSIRKIKIDNLLLKDLLRLKKIYKNCTDDYFIFGGYKPLAPTTINRYKLKACKLANIRPITLHQFRHSHATLLLHNGIVINEISRRLGHSKVSTTLDIYTHTDFLQEKRVYKTLNFLRLQSFDSLTQKFNLLKHYFL